MNNKGIKEQFEEIKDEIVKAMDTKNKIIVSKEQHVTLYSLY